MTVLEATGVEKEFREGRAEVVPVLKGVSIALERGEIVVTDTNAEGAVRPTINAGGEDVLTVADELGYGSVKKEMKLDLAFLSQRYF